MQNVLILLRSTGILTLIQLASMLIMSTGKWFYLKKKGVTAEDRKNIFSVRKPGDNKKESFNLDRLLKTYDEKILRRADSLARKGHHVLTGILYMLFLQLTIKDPSLLALTIIIQSVINLGIMLTAFRSGKTPGWGALVYGGLSRIMDGEKGRLNIVIALLSLTVQYICVSLICLYLILPALGGNSTTLLLFINFIYFPLVIGDASGEIIGGIWGRQRIQVTGIGAVNRKSLLGTAAVFFSTLGALVFHILATGIGIAYFLLAVIISFSATVVELFAPRSMDNALIPISCAMLCLIWVLVTGAIAGVPVV